MSLGALNPFRYRGYYYDTETGFYFLQTRYYDPEVGRFINQDSISYADPQTINGLNLYAYCLNNPVMGSDPYGTTEWREWLIGALVVVGLSVATALTAGFAGAAIAGAAGFSSLASFGVGMTVGASALAGGLAAGTGELINQGIGNSGGSINFGSLAITTLSVCIDSALTVGALFTGPVGTAVLWGSRVLVAGVSSIGYGLNEGYSMSQLAKSFSASIGITATLGQFMFPSKALTLFSLILAPFKTFGGKLLSAIGKNFWKHALYPLLD